jgi:hypothetical protein
MFVWAPRAAIRIANLLHSVANTHLNFLSFLSCFVRYISTKEKAKRLQFMTKADHQRRTYHYLALCLYQVMEAGERLSVRVGVLLCFCDKYNFFCEHNSSVIEST